MAGDSKEEKMEEGDSKEEKMDSPTNSQQTVSDDDEIDYTTKPEFYDPDLDDKDELWVQKKRLVCDSDAVLSCSACFTTLCLECQRMSENINMGEDSVQRDDYKPLWRFVTKGEKEAKGGGNVPFSCNYCGNDYKGTYSRVRAHLLKLKGFGIGICSKVSNKDLVDMKKLEDDACERKLASMPKKIPLPPSNDASKIGSSSSTSSSLHSFRVGSLEVGTKRRKGVEESALEKAYRNQERDELRAHIARMFYSGGLPFHLARNPYYVSSFTYACNHNLAGFIPPGYNLLRNSLLQQEKAHIERMLQPIKTTWKEKGVTIVCDGWSDPQRRPLINFMAVTESGPMFIKAINCEGEYKDKEFIANAIISVIREVGVENVVQVITDNAPVCKAAGVLIEVEYPHIFWTPCVVHTLNLALKSICNVKNKEGNEVAFDELGWIREVADDALMIKNFIMNHNMRLAIFNEFVPLKLLAIADTRFASIIIMLKRFKLVKNGLQLMVISDKWNLYREDDVEKAQFVKEKILNDVWWDKLDFILAFTSPIYDMLRMGDTDKPSLHKIYEGWDSMIEQVKAAIFRHEGKLDSEESTFFNVVYDILVQRWTKSNTPLHCLAHSLTPRHEKYVTRYRAVFVVNCKVENDQVLMKNSSRAIKGKRGTKGIDGVEEHSTNIETFKQVCCSVCLTEVGVIDENEVYHFFNVIPSES